MKGINVVPCRAFQFGLRKLFVWVTLVAIRFRYLPRGDGRSDCGWWPMRSSFRCLRTYVQHTSPVKSRWVVMRKHFWRVVWFTLPIAACANLVTYCETYRIKWLGTDGDCRCIGWPIPFRVEGYGYVGHDSVLRFHRLASRPRSLRLDRGGDGTGTERWRTTACHHDGPLPSRAESDTASPARPGTDLMTGGCSGTATELIADRQRLSSVDQPPVDRRSYDSTGCQRRHDASPKSDFSVHPNG